MSGCVAPRSEQWVAKPKPAGRRWPFAEPLFVSAGDRRPGGSGKAAFQETSRECVATAGSAPRVRASARVGAGANEGGSVRPEEAGERGGTGSAADPTRKRYYLVSPDLVLESAGILFANKEEALVEGSLAGTHERREPGYPHPHFVGVPPLRDKPKVVVGGNGGRSLDCYGGLPVFISTRAKELLAEIDPAGFEFAECETLNSHGEPVEPYWLMDVIRWVETFDEERSDFEWYRDSYPAAPDAQGNPSISALYDIHLPKGFPEEHHAFWFAHYRLHYVFDAALADAWRDRGLTGLRFTPLQRPTDAEFEHSVRFVNHPYWTEKARQP